ncbi:hypothetical protein WL92_22340 [Burkholderia multivorans]|nr:hypothetical protein WL92_22340 [Burkholderia multivorans]
MLKQVADRLLQGYNQPVYDEFDSETTRRQGHIAPHHIFGVGCPKTLPVYRRLLRKYASLAPIKHVNLLGVS